MRIPSLPPHPATHHLNSNPYPAQNFFLYFYGAVFNLLFLAVTALREKQNLSQMFQGGWLPGWLGGLRVAMIMK